MNLQLWFLYVATIFAFMSTPGPSHLLMLSNSIANGFSRSLLTAAGDLSANLIQMIIASAGLAVVVSKAPSALAAIKWMGVAYLLFSGVKIALTPMRADSLEAQQHSLTALYLQGFLTSLANPKAIVFFAALFPQFIMSEVTEVSLLIQVAILSVTYLCVDGLFLATYGKFAELIRRRYLTPLQYHLNRITGGLLILAAVLLSLRSISLELN